MVLCAEECMCVCIYVYVCASRVGKERRGEERTKGGYDEWWSMVSMRA